jgi:hypothetical protein
VSVTGVPARVAELQKAVSARRSDSWRNVTPTFGVRDIDDAIAHLRSREVEVEDWHEIPGMVRLSTFYDPDGTPWMIAQTLDGADKTIRDDGA